MPTSLRHNLTSAYLDAARKLSPKRARRRIVAYVESYDDIAFYEQALGLKEHHRKESSDGSFTLVYLTDGSTGFLLELTCLKEHPQAYELGENESHLCFRVAGDYDAIRQYHKENGWVCFENTAMGLYFINDPDDYWIEILPAK